MTGHRPPLQWKYPDFHEKKDRTENELADKLVEGAAETEDPLELITGFLIQMGGEAHPLSLWLALLDNRR